MCPRRVQIADDHIKVVIGDFKVILRRLKVIDHGLKVIGHGFKAIGGRLNLAWRTMNPIHGWDQSRFEDS
jgi:hypothetical protein